MKNSFLKFIALIAFISSSLFSTLAYAASPIPVVASFSVLGDLVKVVGADRVTVTMLVGYDEDAHAFEPKPSDAKKIVASQLMVINGLHFEPWAVKLAKSASYKGDILIASKGIKPLAKQKKSGHQDEDHEEAGHHHHEHGDQDPHAWQNPNNVKTYVRNIAQALSKIDPASAEFYKANAQTYIKELESLDSAITAQLASIPVAKRKVITSHNAFSYFGTQYQVTFMAAEGVNSKAEPSAKAIAQLIQQIKREKIKAIFLENMKNPKLIEQVSKEAGVTVGAVLYSDALSSKAESGASYLKMMRYNLQLLAEGMKHNS